MASILSACVSGFSWSSSWCISSRARDYKHIGRNVKQVRTGVRSIWTGKSPKMTSIVGPPHEQQGVDCCWDRPWTWIRDTNQRGMYQEGLLQYETVCNAKAPISRMLTFGCLGLGTSDSVGAAGLFCRKPQLQKHGLLLPTSWNSTYSGAFTPICHSVLLGPAQILHHDWCISGLHPQLQISLLTRKHMERA